MPADTLYETDIVAWVEQQARAIPALARTRPDLANALDWENIADEVESLGRSEWKKVASQPRNALAPILKEVCDPDALSRRAWPIETHSALREARDEVLPSMRQHLDIDQIRERAFAQAAGSLQPYGVPIPPGLPQRSPFTVDELLSREFDHASGVSTVMRRIDPSIPPARGQN